MSDAPGRPGEAPTWSASRKSAIGTAKNLVSRIWFTIGEGIISEIYYPRIDLPSVRDFGLFVADGETFVSDEQSDARHTLRWLADGIPAFELTSRCKAGRYVLNKQIVTNPDTHALLQLTRFAPAVPNLRLYARLTPHLRDCGEDNRGWVGDYNGLPLLMAERDDAGVAVGCSVSWLKRSAGYVGRSDGWVDLLKHKRMEWEYPMAECGNVALTGEVDVAQADEFLLVIAFGQNAHEAGFRVRQTLLKGFDACWQQYRDQWQAWHDTLHTPPADLLRDGGVNISWRISAAVLATHESKDMRGGLIASLSSPWGNHRGDNDRDGYHVVWPRDCCETAGAMLAAGAGEECKRVLDYLRCTQSADGSWPQSTWLSGKPAQDGLQLDEVALPILTLDLVRRENVNIRLESYWQMVQRAAQFIATRGPGTAEDRWEHNPGYTPFTLATEIAALLVAADYAQQMGHDALAADWRGMADDWEALIDAWLYATDTDLARRVGVEGYYVRIAPYDARQIPLAKQRVELANTKPTQHIAAADLISPDALALVRFGLRAADDPRMINTVKVIDALLKTDTSRGPAWHRYNQDRYGETPDGSAFQPHAGTGIGRAWPLLTGERAHYELAAGRPDAARALLDALITFGGKSGMISEQVWDSPDLPAANLYRGHATFSARPLVWAHAEQIKLIRSLELGRMFDLPPLAYERYARRG